jgi:hypothetical protein
MMKISGRTISVTITKIQNTSHITLATKFPNVNF